MSVTRRRVLLYVFLSSSLSPRLASPRPSLAVFQLVDLIGEERHAVTPSWHASSAAGQDMPLTAELPSVVLPPQPHLALTSIQSAHRCHFHDNAMKIVQLGSYKQEPKLERGLSGRKPSTALGLSQRGFWEAKLKIIMQKGINFRPSHWFRCS